MLEGPHTGRSASVGDTARPLLHVDDQSGSCRYCGRGLEYLPFRTAVRWYSLHA